MPEEREHSAFILYTLELHLREVYVSINVTQDAISVKRITNRREREREMNFLEYSLMFNYWDEERDVAIERLSLFH